MIERVAKLEQTVADIGAQVHDLDTYQAGQAVLIDGIREDLAELKTDVRQVRDAIVGAKWAGRALLAAAAGVGAVITWVLS